MAWFGDTIGDGLTSLKGQFTKITEKVLLDDPLAATSFEGRIKELEEECARYLKQVECLQAENKRLNEGRSFEISDDQILNMCQLENQLAEVIAERDALNKTLDEMDVDHQKELDILIKDRNSLREMLKGNLSNEINNHAATDDPKIEELNAAIQQLQLQNDILFEEGKNKDQDLRQHRDEVERLRKMIAALELKADQQAAEHLEMVARTEKLENDLHSVDSERSHLENEVQDLRSVIQEAENNLSAVRIEKESLNESVERLKSQLAEKEGQLKELQSDVATTTEQYISYEGKVETLSQENESLKVKLERFSTNIFKNDETASLIKENEKLIENLAVCETLIASYKSKERAIEENSKAFETLQSENLSLQEKCGVLETTMNNLQEDVVAAAEKTIEMLTLEIVELKNNLSASSELQSKLQEADNVIQNLMLEIQKNEESKVSFGVLTTENEELQNRVKALEQDAVAKFEEIRQENEELRNQLKSIAGENSSKLAELTDDNSKLKQQLEAIAGENTATLESLTTKNSILEYQVREKAATIEALSKENAQLELKLQEITDLREETVKEINELKIKLRDRKGDEIEPDSLAAENLELKEKLQKLEALVAQTEERENLVSGTLGLEIRKLKGIVGRIRREFLRSSNQREEPTSEDGAEDRSGKDVMIQSQTDDVKRLQQDVSQMTEIIKMIDQGLTTIYQDKSMVEKELAVLKSVAARTEQDLTVTVKAKQQLEANIREWAIALASRDEAIQTLMSEKTSLENSVKVLEDEKTSLVAFSSAQGDEIKRLETDKGALQEKLQLAERSSDEWKTRLDQLQTLYENEAKRSEDLCRKKDAHIAELSRNGQSSSTEEGEIIEESVERLTVEKSNVNSEKMPEISDLQDQVLRLVDENSDLKMLVQQLRENIFAMNTRAPDGSSKHSQHRRSHSEVEDHKTELQTEQARYHALLGEHKNLIEKEENLRREVDRLREHMVEVEEHYTEEAMNAEATLADLRDKLAFAEEQLRSSSTVYKSANVRSTQHLEALQTQIHLMGVQRTDLQKKLSDAEDYAQKQAAALASLQLVLEQFQLDKQRELQAVEEKHKHQIELERRHAQELEYEIENLKQQLMEAKNGLKAALRLGEQLEKKSLLISELEEDLKKTRGDLALAESKLSTYSQSTAGKIDKSLVKNLVVGYLGAQGDHKAQALKILSSVLEMSPEERSRVGVEGQGGWLSHLLHPSSSSAPPTESLSQAFVRFLESESRPQPQLKLLTEPQASHVISKRAPLLLSDLVLPPVTPTHVTDPGLSDVLRDS